MFIDPYQIQHAIKNGIDLPFVTDAPSDGQVYGRQNGVWVVIPFQLSATFYFQNTASDIATYLKQLGTPYSPKTGLASGPFGAGNHLLKNFVTDPTIPGFAFIPAGPYSVHVHAAKTAGTKSAAVYAEIWECTSLGVDIGLIGTTEISPVLTGTEVEFEIVYVDANTHTLNSTNSRIVTRMFASIGAAGSNATVTLYVGGLADSHITFPAPNP